MNPRVTARQLGIRLPDLERFFVPCATLDQIELVASLNDAVIELAGR
jgi:hypothetical protein